MLPKYLLANKNNNRCSTLNYENVMEAHLAKLQSVYVGNLFLILGRQKF